MNIIRTLTLIDKREAWLKLRERNVNASEIAALFGCHPYTSALRLWAEKTGQLPREHAENMATRRGHIFEAAVGEALRLMHPDWKIFQGNTYAQAPDERIGATPDFTGEEGDERRGFLIQAKTVIPDKWEEEWTPAPPAHFLLQVQCEMLVTGVNRALLAAMVMDGREFPVHEYWFDADYDLHSQILQRVAQFWAAVRDLREPKLEATDGQTIAQLYPSPIAEVGLLHGNDAVIEACRAHKKYSAEIKALEAKKEAAATVIMSHMRNYSKAEAGTFGISWPAIAGSTYTVNRKPHRRLTITEKG